MKIKKIYKFKSYLSSKFSEFIFHHIGYPKIKEENISKFLIRKYLPKNPVMIDCGAHNGSDSLELVRILKGTCHCFEPVPTIFDRLVKNTEGNKAIYCYQIALSDSNGIMKMYISTGETDSSSSLLKPKEHLKDHPGVLFDHEIEVKSLTLNKWCEHNNINKIDLLWLDMQGFELRMLKASQEILQTVSAIHTEVSVKETYESCAKYIELKSFLEDFGFELLLEAIPDGWDMGNVLFVKKSLITAK